MFVAWVIGFADRVYACLGAVPRRSPAILRVARRPDRGFAGTIRLPLHDGGIMVAAELRSAHPIRLLRARGRRVRFSFPHSRAFPGARVIVGDDGLAEGRGPGTVRRGGAIGFVRVIDSHVPAVEKIIDGAGSIHAEARRDEYRRAGWTRSTSMAVREAVVVGSLLPLRG